MSCELTKSRVHRIREGVSQLPLIRRHLFVIGRFENESENA